MSHAQPWARRVSGRLRQAALGLRDAVGLGAALAVALALLDAGLRGLGVLDPPTSRVMLGLVAGIGPELALRMVPRLVDSTTAWAGLLVPLALLAALLPGRGPALIGRGSLALLLGLFVAAIVLVGYMELGEDHGWQLFAALLGVVGGAALGVRRWPTRQRAVVAGAGALAFVVGGASFMIGQRAAITRAQAAGPSGELVSTVAAYDLLVLSGAPESAPDLVFSTQAELYTLELEPRPTLTPQVWAKQEWWERFVASDDPARPFAADPGSGVFKLDFLAQEFERFNSSFGERPACLDFDPVRGWLLVANEWHGRLAVYDAASGELVHGLDRSPFLGTAPWLSRDGDRLFLSSMLGDGDLQVLALDDELRELDRVRDLFVYHTLVDRQRGLLWAGRPLFGELLVLDLETLEIRARTRLATGPRDLVLDDQAGQLFVNTYPAGELFRVDVATHEVIERGSCGWRCRSLALDPQRRLLWAASRAGVMAIALDQPFGTALDQPFGAALERVGQAQLRAQERRE